MCIRDSTRRAQRREPALSMRPASASIRRRSGRGSSATARNRRRRTRRRRTRPPQSSLVPRPFEYCRSPFARCVLISSAKCCPEASGSVLRLRAVVVHEHLAVAAIAEEGSTELPELRRCLDPARRLGVELAQLLQRSVLFLGQQIDAHGGRHVDRASRRLVLFPGCKRFLVVADAPAPGGALCRAVAEDVPARRVV